jgi:hypothetical protein
VVDEEGAAVPGCIVKGGVFTHWESGEGFGRDHYDVTKLTSDQQGNAQFAIKAKRKDLTYRVDEPEGYYSSHGVEYNFNSSKNGIWQPKNKKFIITLKRKKNPIAMYARRVGGGKKVQIPEVGKAFGFDLVVSDWVAPHGKGRKPDLLFQLAREQKGQRDYDATFTMTFPNKGDGLVSYQASIDRGSFLVMPYTAPEIGYENTLVKYARARPKANLVSGYSKDQHYFIRVRTVLDEEGNVVSALYGKIQGDIQFWINQVIRFNYYLNPTSNDRNVEFDLKQNLLKNITSTERVIKP